MEIVTSIISALFSILTVVASVILVAAPFFVRNQPVEKARKILLLSVILAAAALVLYFVAGGITTLVQLSHWGADATSIATTLGQITGNVFCVIYLAYPILFYLLKKQNNLIALVLILPIIPSFAQIILSAIGGNLGMTSNIGAIVPGVFVGILMLLFFVLSLVWALTGRKPVLSKIVIIAAPVTFVLSFVLSYFASNTMYTRLGVSTNFLLNLNGTENFFTMPLRLLILSILNVAIHSLFSAAPVQPQYIGHQFISPQPVAQPNPYPVAPQYPVQDAWEEDRTVILPQEDPGTELMADEEATGILQEKFCPMCGNTLPADATVCNVCGNTL